MKPLTVSLVQADLQWEDKEANLKMLEARIDAVTDKMELVILPEMFSTGFTMNAPSLAEKMDGPIMHWMRDIAARKKIILTGSIIIEEGGHYFNRLVWMLPGGEFGYYDKRHLFAYAGEDSAYTPGNKRLIASVKGWKVNLQICYDLRFPVWARHSKPIPEKKSDSHVIPPEYDVLIYVANWPDKRSHAWRTLLQARAIENQAYVIGVNRIGTDAQGHYYQGDSMVADPFGQVVCTAGDRPETVTCVLNAELLNETRNKLPFLKDADPFRIGN